MSILISLSLVAACILASGLYSGGETGIYGLSRVRVDLEAQQGLPSAVRIRRLLSDQTGLLITLLIANNLVNQATTYAGRDVLVSLGVPLVAQEVVLTLLVTPVLFLCGELLPKDLFRRRPHSLVGRIAPVLVVTKWLTMPIGIVLRGVVGLVERLTGLDAGELARMRGREERVLELLREQEDDRERMERMARNVLGLRSLRVERVMVPWARVHTLQASLTSEQVREKLAAAANTRLPMCGEGGRVLGYVHQLEVLADGAGRDPATRLRPMLSIDPRTPLDRALARLQAEGQRMALVGPAERPLGLVTIKDLVEEISGELSRW